MFFSQYVLVAGHGAENIADPSSFVHGHYAEAVHHGFERFGRIDLRHDHLGSGATRTTGQASSTPAVARDHEFRSGQQIVGGADDAVNCGLPGAVAVVEQVLGISIVHGDDGESQHAFFGHGTQANYSGGSFFGAADHAIERVLTLGMQQGHKIGAIVHGDVRFVIDSGQNVAILAFDGEDGNAVIAHQAGGHVVLRR